MNTTQVQNYERSEADRAGGIESHERLGAENYERPQAQDYERSLERSRRSLTREDRPPTLTMGGREWDLLDEVFAPVYSPSTGVALHFLGLSGAEGFVRDVEDGSISPGQWRNAAINTNGTV